MSFDEAVTAPSQKERFNTGKMLGEILLMVFPSIIEYSFQTLVNYADLIMVGRLGIEASATVGITNEVTFLMKAGVNALGVGVLAYVAKEYGAGNKDKLSLAAYKAYELALVVGIATTLIPIAISPFLPGFMGADEAIRKPASMYFAICASSGVFFSFNVVAGSIRKAAKDMKTPLLVNGLVNIINVVLNYFLIFPSRSDSLLGREFTLYRADLGVQGAAIGTAISTAVGGILMLIANEKHKETAARPLLGTDLTPFREEGKSISRKYILVGLPAFLTSVVTSFGRVIFTSMIVPLGTTIYAAHTIAFTAESAFYMPAVGMSAAVASLSGNVRGEGNIKKLNRQTNMVCGLMTLIMLFATVILLTCAGGIIDLFTDDPFVLELAPKLLHIVAINEPLFGISVVMQNVFNGIGKTKPPLYISLFTQWAIRVLGAYIFVFRLGYGVKAAWFCMIADNIVRAILLYVYYYVFNDKLLD